MFNQVDLTKGISIRPTRPADGEWERLIHDAGRPELNFIDGEQEFIQSIFDLQYRARNQGYGSSYPNAMYFMIEKNGDTIGRAVIDFDNNDAHIVDLSIHPLHQNKGYGQVILEALKNVAAKAGAPLSLSVRRDNQKAIDLYAKMGFRPADVKQQDPMRVLFEWLPTKEHGRRIFI